MHETLSVNRSGTFVGRERELDELVQALDEADAGRGRLALIAGEAGIGKTRLAEELAARATTASARVLWGRCWEGDGAPAFWPWVQVIRAALADIGHASLPALERDGAARLAQLAPELANRLGAAPSDFPGEDPDRARFRLFDVIATFLKNVAESRPLLVILDDLHWADPSSLLLLKFVAAELRGARILVLGLYREIEARRSERMQVVIGDLGREAREITLRGLDDAEVGRFIAAAAATTPHEALVRAVHEATSGNPFFVSEIVRLLSAHDSNGRWAEVAPRSLPVPPSARATIRRRIDTLPEGSREVLSLASFIGREFDLVTLERAGGLDPDVVLDRLGAAVADGFVERAPNAVAVYRFSHDLVRETFYEEATPAERVRRHRTVGEAIEELHRTRLDAHAGELAHHFAEAAAGGDAGKALAYAVRAAERANAALAYEEAVEHLENARRIVELYELRDDAFRFELLLALGEAHKRAGAINAAKTCFCAAAEMAEALGSPDALARAALGYPAAFAGLGGDPEPANEMLVAWLRRSLVGIPSPEVALRARLLSRLAVEIAFTQASGDSLALSTEAVRLAREAGDLSVIAGVLVTRLRLLGGPGPRDESLATVEEILRIAGETHSKELSILGRVWRITAHFQSGDRAALDTEIEMQATLAEELREPRYRWLAALHVATRALLSAESTEAEQIARRTLALGAGTAATSAALAFSYQILQPLRDQGRLGEVVDVHRRAFERNPGIPLFPAVVAWLHAELGRLGEARQALDMLAARGFGDFRLDPAWSISVTMLAEVADKLADVPSAHALYDLLLPFAGDYAVVGPGVAYLGSFAHYLGILATRLGRSQAAAEHFEAALLREAKMGASRFAARTAHEYARMLLERDHAGDRALAAELLDRVVETGEALGMGALLQSVRPLRAGREWPPLAEPRSPAATPPSTGNIFRREGDYWTLAFESDMVRMRDMKGLRYLAELLREPGREFHVGDLVLLLHGSQALRPTGGDAGEVLDTRARAAYLRRIEDLRADLQEAERFNDPARASAARGEIERIAAELAGAYGLGGRSRRASSDAERARLMVTQRIRGAIRKITAMRPALGRHLGASIRTGSFCSYVPQTPIAWEL